MKLYFNPSTLPTTEDLNAIAASIATLKDTLQSLKVSLSMEERQNKRKMGSRRTAYAQTAQLKGVQHEAVLPRNFDPADFTTLLSFHGQMQQLLSQSKEVVELLDDTLMAAGIDAMTYTKKVHDSIRLANLSDPSFDAALGELDEFNKKAQAETEEENPVPPSDNP